MSQLQFPSLPSGGSAPTSTHVGLESILDWSAIVSRQSLAEALRSDLKHVLSCALPEMANRDFKIRFLPSPTPVVGNCAPLNPMGTSSFRTVAIQSGNNRWGYLEFAEESQAYSPVGLSVSGEDTLRVALRMIAERLDWIQERERLGHALHRLCHVAGAAVHEVRNPLTSLRLQLHLLQRTLGDGNGPSKQLVFDMEAELQRVSGHLEDLSTITQFKVGKFSLVQTKVDLLPSIRDLIARHSRLFELRKTRCTFSSRASEVMGNWDVFRIQQVIGNLLSNAWKYGDSKPVEVTVDVQNSDSVECFIPSCGKKSCCVIRVRDQGRGMDAESASRIFEGFFRAKNAALQPGTGLGLYVSLNLLKSMGGTLTVKSKIGEGSEFIACIPRNL